MRVLVIAARVVGHRCLEAILESGAEVCALLFLDDVKASVTVAHSPFDDLIGKYQLQAQAFATLKGNQGEHHLDFARQAAPDLGIVVGVSELVPDELLVLPPKGFIGMHPTLLPKGRGRAPIPWALIHDLKETGVTLFYAESGADTGDILAQAKVPIFDTDTAPVLGARTDDVACRLFVENLPKLAAGTAPRLRQNDAEATNWPRRRPEDGVIDWRKDARALYNWVRALTWPYPGAFTFVNGRKLTVWAAAERRAPCKSAPGEVIGVEGDAVLVATANGALALTDVQWDGEAPRAPRLAGLVPGMMLGNADERAVA
ncbi:MAG: methionyl-tRNA formyltransferase [Pseudomonadota bacterium]|nr:methionyl-tRNA formyltransferase [Pseudomonadota bacterium]